MLQGKAMAVSCTNSSLPSWVKVPLDKVVSVADHTYVECASTGKTWECHGRNYGGSVIVSKVGCDRNADCLYGNDEAGIKYLITGVCHQIANRTLTSANVTVHKAKCYVLSVATYGEYGLYQAKWLSRQRECRAPGSLSTNHNYLYRALISKRIALQKRLMPMTEINGLFPNIQYNLKVTLQKLTTKWKLDFLEHAIYYYKNQDFHRFYNHMHNGLNNYACQCAKVIGFVDMAKLLRLEKYDETVHILLWLPESLS